MSVRVNLLPEATRTQDRARQQQLAAVAGGLLLLVGLGGVWWWAQAQVGDAEDRLAAEQLVTTTLRAEEAALGPFRELAAARETADATVVVALGGEVSIAGLLQDLAAVLPPEAQIDALGIAVQTPASPAPRTVGSITLSGQAVGNHAPAVENVLLSLGRMSSFVDLHVGTSSVNIDGPEPVSTFNLESAIDAQALTGRYTDGVQGVLR